ncbi:MAG: hypothetical protein H6811_03005 [Phycisphaeraceae bacterium]|nr:hypothetical protein [Phycisphaeraceae bacterium]
MNKSRRAYVAVLGMAVTGLIADQLFFGPGSGPSPASAVALVDGSAPASGSGSTTLAMSTMDLLAGRLREMEDAAAEAGAPDAFRIPDEWRQMLRPRAEGEAAAQTWDLTLNSIVGGARPYALFAGPDGQVLRDDSKGLRQFTAGMEVGGYAIESINADGLTLSRDGATYLLQMGSKQPRVSGR